MISLYFLSCKLLMEEKLQSIRIYFWRHFTGLVQSLEYAPSSHESDTC